VTAVPGHVLVIALAHLEIAGAVLPPLCRIVDPLLQAFGLLVLGHVQEHLHDRGPFVDEHPLELANVPNATLPNLLRSQASTPTVTMSS